MSSCLISTKPWKNVSPNWAADRQTMHRPAPYPSVRLTVLLGIYLLFSLVSCEDEPINSSLDTTNPTLANFPIGVGSEWTYRRTDSLAATVTTVTVTIDAILPSIPSVAATQWLVSDGSGEDTLVVTIAGDSVTLDGSPQYAQGLLGRYVFPFIVGDRWPGLSPVDTVRVVSRGRTVTPVQTFDNAFEIERELQLPNQVTTWTHWFVPDIGIVKLSYRDFLFGPVANETWELTGYRLE